MASLRQLRQALAVLQPSALACVRARCPLCGPTLLVRLNHSEQGVRCVRCGASAVHLSLGAVLRATCPDLRRRDAYELSARGPLVAWLRREVRSLTLSEYLPDVPAGTVRGGVRSEDVQRLSFADASFDLVTHTEVLEHVPDDRRALAELQRVLRPGGLMLFTVPLHDAGCTRERARRHGDRIEHLLEPAWHTDPLRGGAGILVYRDYGRDLPARVRAAGFGEVALQLPHPPLPWLPPRAVVVARKDLA